MADMTYDFLGRGGSASSYSSGDAAWNAYMSSPASKADPFAPSPSSLGYGVGQPRSGTTSGPVIQGSTGQAFQKLSSGGYVNLNTGQTVSGITRANPNIMAGSGGGGGYGGGGGGAMSSRISMGGGSSAVRPIEYYLGASPTISNLDLSGPMNQFRGMFNQLNSGVNPNFNVDAAQVASDAVAAAKKLNLSPEQIKNMIAGVNPTTGEIISDVQAISKALNPTTGEIISDVQTISRALNPKSAEQISAEAAKYAEENASKIANTLNAKYQSAFAAAMPGYQQNMAIANKLTTTYLKGQIPQDVVDQVYRGAAAKGFTTGLFGGGIGRNIVARDLGLTSLQLQSAGANLLQQTAQIASQVVQSTMPVSGAEFVSGLASGYAGTAARFMTDPNQIFSTVANMRRVDPNQIFSSVVNMKRVDPNTIFNAVYVKPSDVYSQMSSMAQQSTLARANFEASKIISPERVFDTLVTQAQYNQQIAPQNALNAWQTQPIPGQFDVSRGQYVGTKPGTYSDTRPLAPGTTASAADPFASIATKPSWTPYQAPAKDPSYGQIQRQITETNAYNVEANQMAQEVNQARRQLQFEQAMSQAQGGMYA